MRGFRRVAGGARPVRAFVPLAVAMALLLSGCSGADPHAAKHSSSAGAGAGSEAPTGAASGVSSPSVAPALHPDGTAQDNLPLFTAVVARVWAGADRASARAYVDALTTAGFTRSDMQMTADETTVGNPAESIQFSVRWGGAECLVGQVGPSTGDPATEVLPQLESGRCLVGKTATIEP